MFHSLLPGHTVQPIVTVPAPIDLTNDINYNVTFIVSLPIEEIQRNRSETSTIIAAEIIDLFENSSINETFLSCVVESFRAEMVNSSRVTANCSFQNVSTMEPINREKVYDVFSEKTHYISSLGSYLLQSNSLYVNDFTVQPNVNEPPIVPEQNKPDNQENPGHTVQPIVTVPAPIDLTNDINYNMTFIVSLPFEEIKRNPSETSTIFAVEIIALFENSIINATFLTCVVESFRAEMVNSSRVTANCSFQNVSTMEPINREKVYAVFSEKTNGISSLGPYLLQSYSLYVNGHTVQPIVTVPAPIDLTNDINYNMTFIVSLPIEEIQRNPSETSTIFAVEIIALFENSIINATFLTCVVESFRAEMVNSSRVTANCSFQNVSTMEPINREKVYAVFSEKTNGISSLGPYLLQSYSLYVNDFTVQPNVNEPPIVPEENKPSNQENPGHTVQPIVTVPAPIDLTNAINYNVTFIVSLPIEEIQRNPSETSTIIAAEIIDLFKNSSINETFLTCVVESFSAEMFTSTRVTANCSFQNVSSMEPINREKVYAVFSEKTKNISSLGPYVLQSYSLYVNDYNESPSRNAPIATQTPVEFNVTFIVTNLPFSALLHEKTSPLYQSASAIITGELNTLLRNSEIKAQFDNCETKSLSVLGQNTQVYAICTFNNSATRPIDRVTVYRQISYNTDSITKLGPYLLDSNSLYVDDYNELTPPSPPIAKQTSNEFNVTFILTNLPFMGLLHEKTSPLYQSASAIITGELNTLFRNSEIKAQFDNCETKSLSALGQNTQVYAICTFNSSATRTIDRVTVYRQISYNTNVITTLGPYLLDSNSLYVDDYNESTPSEPIGKVIPGFNVTFILTSLTYTAAFNDPSSLLYQSASESIIWKLKNHFENSDIASAFTGCKVITLSAANNKGTGVYAICSFNNTSAAENVDRVIVYRQFSYTTRNITKLGQYLLDPNSLYVNGYHKSNEPNDSPNRSQFPTLFNMTFTVTNLPYVNAFDTRTSFLYQSAVLTITHQLTTLFNNSDITSAFIACNTRSLSTASMMMTKVYALCSFNSISTENEDRIIIYHQFRYNTRNITIFGAYSLDNNSLYVNDYHESAYPLTTSQQPGQKTLCFDVPVIITNLPFSSVLLDPTSSVYQSASALVIYQLNAIFRNSKINARFLECSNILLSVTNEGFVKALADCFFKNYSQQIDNVIVEQGFRDGTNKTSSTATYEFNTNNVQITGCEEAKSTITAAAPGQPPTIASARQRDLPFQINFTIVNVNFTDQLQILNSSEYINLTTNIIARLQDLFTNSDLSECYKFCNVSNLSSGSVKVSTSCYFDPFKQNTVITSELIKSNFDIGTNGSMQLGEFQLKSGSVIVAGKPPGPLNGSELPYWAIIVIVLAILLALFLLVILSSLITLCVKKKFHGFYDMLQNPFGIYYSHLDGK
ncbi:mucin-16-like [Amblyraja radiata]|uniref:mucin-16-like n=1 Tax=Amblyraja radiata TaxID=386614 RepID=UPI0014034A4C|nr:mucin-16-like [Amblyraja radiata]